MIPGKYEVGALIQITSVSSNFFGWYGEVIKTTQSDSDRYYCKVLPPPNSHIQYATQLLLTFHKDELTLRTG